MNIEHFFDKDTNTLTYLLFDPITRDAIVIDPILNYDPDGGVITDSSVLSLCSRLKEQSLNLQLILETHAHADHLSGARRLQEFYSAARIAIGAQIIEVQKLFRDVFEMEELISDGGQFDLLLEDEKKYRAGSLSFEVIWTPGHTPACCSYLFGSCVFVGDLIFMPDYGTGRCDFPGGSSRVMFDSVKNKLFRLPDVTRVFVGHDYMPNGRMLKFETTVAELKRSNIQLNEDTELKDFETFRNSRDQGLKAPRLLYPSVQFNIAGANLPPPSSSGKLFFKIPLSLKLTGK